MTLLENAGGAREEGGEERQMKKSWPTLLDGTTHLRLAACTWGGGAAATCEEGHEW